MAVDATFAILVALILSVTLLRLGRRGPGPWSGLLFFFLLFLLVNWAANLWMLPVGPEFFGAYWLGPLLVAALLALILLAVMPHHSARGYRDPRYQGPEDETPEETRTRHAIELTFSLFFWIAIAGLALVVLIGYFTR